MKKQRIWALWSLLFCWLCLAGTATAASEIKDLPQDPEAAAAVRYVTEKGLMSCTPEGNFLPEAKVSREQMLMCLYRLVGEPEPAGSNDFLDVTADNPYLPAIDWAATGKVKTSGLSRNLVRSNAFGVFKPHQTLTRNELAMLTRVFAQSCNLSVKYDDEAVKNSAVVQDCLKSIRRERTTSTMFYVDDAVAARESIIWCVFTGIIKPQTPENFGGDEAVSRLDAAQALYGLVKLYGEHSFKTVQSEVHKTVIERSDLATIRGRVIVEYEVQFHFANRDDAVYPVWLNSSMVGPSLLFRNYFNDRSDVHPDNPIVQEDYIKNINDPDCTGITIWLQRIVLGEGAALAQIGFKGGSRVYTAGTDTSDYGAEFYSGLVKVQMTKDLYELSCWNGKFTDNTDIMLTFKQ